ncbi:MAG: sulfite exporter TauE/SafE family protein [Alphaproteobacteria bacterium]|uniref:sulfite exporter TauE/SafE family protein n=1 Tax=Pyruvatibacter sp. HU-CL02332 TaxID=3127650 RepID=UPI00296A66E5|nr:sulfite exporter TauE/SafE family protein [Alphaproteobacteria bacterium]
MIEDPWFYIAAVPAVLIVGISKGGFAAGFGILGVPLMALVISPLQAAAILLPILLAMDVVGLWAYRRNFDMPNLRILIPAAAVGIGIGWMTASLVQSEHVALIVGLVALAFAADFWTGQRREGVPGRSVRKGGFWGAIAGFTSFVAHAGGPPFQVYMLPQRLDKTLYVGTSVVFFWAVNLIKVPPYLALGQFDTTNLLTALVLMPLAPIGILVGVKLHHLIPEEPFYKLCYAGVTLVGLKLVYDASIDLFV